MKMQLKDLIEFASAQAEKIFRSSGKLLPMYHAFKSNGEQLVFNSPPGNKDVSVGIVKIIFEKEDVESYVFMSEAWMVSTTPDHEPDLEAMMRRGLEYHPERREVIAFSAEDREGNAQTAFRFILRPEHGKARLTKLALDDMTNRESAGRMVGLLREEAQQ